MSIALCPACNIPVYATDPQAHVAPIRYENMTASAVMCPNCGKRVGSFVETDSSPDNHWEFLPLEGIVLLHTVSA
jgi:endogenous inhibitor of DNA gyrase (YacG/DUF329 family)